VLFLFGLRTRINSIQLLIVSYVNTPGADLQDHVNGHGTHVVGSIVGNALDSNSTNQEFAAVHDGVAPAAKISFTDVGDSDGVSPILSFFLYEIENLNNIISLMFLMQNMYVPDTLNNGYFFQHHYDLGARIHSNSWGCSHPNPTYCNIYVAEIVWEGGIIKLGGRGFFTF